MKDLFRIATACALSLVLCSCSASESTGTSGQSQTPNEVVETTEEFDAVLPDRQEPLKLVDEANVVEQNASPVMDQSLQASAEELSATEAEEAEGSGGWISELEPYVPTDSSETDEVSNSEGNSGIVSSQGYTEPLSVIIGGDDRVTVTDTYAYPFSAIAYMEARAKCGCDWVCTGFMVSPDVLLTASHCVVCPTHSQPADEIQFYFGLRPDGSYANAYFDHFTYYYGTDFRNGYTDASMAWDYAVVKLEENIGNETGWFGVKVASDYEFGNRTYRIAGYRDGILKYDTNRTEVHNDRLIRTYADALPGNSGSPTYSNGYASAIWIAESREPNANYCCRITQDVLNKILEMDGKKPTTTGDQNENLVVKSADTGSNGYVLPYVQSHYYTRSELESLSTYDLYIGRNEIPARHGLKFSNGDLKSYFNSKSWYNGTLTGDQFRQIEGILSGVEEANVDTILALERSRGSSYTP